MNPGSNPYATRVFGAPPGMEGDVHPLEVTEGTDSRGKHVFASAWEPCEHEIDALRRGEGVWITLWAARAVPVAINVGREPSTVRPVPDKAILAHDAEGHPVYAVRLSLAPHERAALIEGERLWLVVWCDGLPPACVEIAELPYFAA